MIVTLDASLFTDPCRNDILLLEILQLGRERLVVKTRPNFSNGGPISAWLAKQSENAREHAELGLKRGVLEQRYSKPELRILFQSNVLPEWPDDLSREITLPLTDKTAEFVKRPLRIMVENERNDWGFLQRVVPSDWKKRFEQAIQNHWVEPQGVGIDEMRKVFEDRNRAHDREYLARCVAVFDSDARSRCDRCRALSPPPTSPKLSGSELTELMCQTAGVSYHRLRRRNIESYLPKQSLYDFANRGRPPAKAEERRQKVDAFFNLPSDEQRHYFNLKNGLAGDRKSDRRLAEIYDGLSEDEKRVLESGFDEKDETLVSIWRDTETYGVSEDALDRDGSNDERHQIFQTLFSRL